MTEDNIITLGSLYKLVKDGYSIYRIPKDWGRSIHKLVIGKWGLKWIGVHLDCPDGCKEKLKELLKDKKSLEIL